MSPNNPRRACFDSQRAFGYLKQQLLFGPRIPGTLGHQRTGEWILEHLNATAEKVVVQDISHVTSHGDLLHLRNFLARFRLSARARVLFLAHWDTRPYSDRCEDSRQRALPVPGANDGASGVAVLLALADALQAYPPALGVDLLFVDGEDYGDHETGDGNDVLIGSRYYAACQPTGSPPLFAVLVDMVGKKGAEFYYEGNSYAFAGDIVELVWRTASELGHGGIFHPTVRHTVVDDHLPLQKAGIPAIAVMDFDYQYWHTPDDTLDKVAPESLRVVGEVALALTRANSWISSRD